MLATSDDYVVEDFDFQQLPGANQVAGDFDVRLGWSRIITVALMRPINFLPASRPRVIAMPASLDWAAIASPSERREKIRTIQL